ncbi:hypothetical protein AVEN_97755-1 [Araneus ventricosus]|uniref:Uncharacterized protein n=1 Tax=Araneus ventricosus TaxID=182803 RepID=A0A4Y2E4W4_ARAVE|nr:hypothetical protein AVEN_97755-1 [Araneus ventricosus]
MAFINYKVKSENGKKEFIIIIINPPGGTNQIRFRYPFNRKPCYPRRYDSSSTEAGLLVANHLATARTLPKEIRTIRGVRTLSTPKGSDFLRSDPQATHLGTSGAPRGITISA